MRSFDIAPTHSDLFDFVAPNNTTHYDTGLSRVTQLDFSSFDSSNVDGLNIQWASVLANALLTIPKDTEISVTLPKTTFGHKRLAQAGLYFALARHGGLNHEKLSDDEAVRLNPWLNDWEPCNYKNPLFNWLPGTDGPEDNQMIAFLNPDQIPKIGFEPELLGDIYPWLRFMLEQEGMGVADKEIRESFLRSVGTIAIELVENMRDHAELGFNGLCSLSVFNTDSTLYISAFDNGRGTVASLAEWPHSLTHLSPQERLLLPFSSNMLRGPRNRGDGIQRRIVARTHALQGSVFMTSSAQEGTVYVTHNYTEEPRVSTQAGLKTQGTTTVVAIPLAPLL